MEWKHWAWIVRGDPREIEATIEDSIIARNGIANTREIGGDGQWSWEDCRFSIEWMRLASPIGIRLDLMIDPDACGWNEAAILDEVRRVILRGRFQLESGLETATAELLPGDGVAGAPIAELNGRTIAGEVATTNRAGLIAATIAGGVVAVTSGSALWICRKRKDCKKRPIVVGALFASLLVATGCGAVLWLSRSK